jgi:prepilin-type N-terminal cleavage/methylation domain-containing protein
MKKSKSYSGFSLIEILLVISILVIISTSVFLWFANYQRQTEIESASKMIMSSLRDARSRSTSGKDFMKWGVFFDGANNKFILFRDEGGYAGATVKEETYLSKYVEFDSASLSGGCNEIIFEKINGATAQNCAIKIADKSNASNFIDITITSSGLISN